MTDQYFDEFEKSFKRAQTGRCDSHRERKTKLSISYLKITVIGDLIDVLLQKHRTVDYLKNKI